MFEAIFQADEPTVLRALGFSSRPKDWPRFRTYEKEIDKRVIDPAVECKERAPGRYLAHKSRWGEQIVKAADSNARLWRHPIATRLCRTLAA
jgi:hypothetical protein